MNYLRHLVLEYLAILRYVGALLLGVGVCLLLPQAVLLFFPGRSHPLWTFLWPALLTFIVGGALWLLIPDENLPSLSLREAAVVVTLSWGAAILLGGLPFCLGGQLTLLDGIFEATSGFTGTGLTMLNPDVTPPIFLLWRSIMEYLGSAGFAVMMLSALIGPRASGLYEAEARTDRLVPSVLDTARLFMVLYLIYLLLGSFLYVLAGMTPFDSVNHAMAALSAGGFSTRSASIAHWDSPAVEGVTILLMVLGTTNFTTHLAVYTRRSFRPLWDHEVLLFWALIIVSTLLLTRADGISFRAALFQAVSSLTTTGFATVDLARWGDLGVLVLSLLMILGAGTGATAGAIKLYRVSVAFHTIGWSVQEKLRPRHAVRRRLIRRRGEAQPLGQDQIDEALAYIAIYLLAVLLGMVVFLRAGFTLRESLFEFSSALGTAGLSLGLTKPAMPLGPKLAQILAMLLGRLEFMAVLVTIIKLCGDARDLIHYLFSPKN